MARGAAAWRPVVMLPEFRFPGSEKEGKELLLFASRKYGKCNPEEHQ